MGCNPVLATHRRPYETRTGLAIDVTAWSGGGACRLWGRGESWIIRRRLGRRRCGRLIRLCGSRRLDLVFDAGADRFDQGLDGATQAIVVGSVRRGSGGRRRILRRRLRRCVRRGRVFFTAEWSKRRGCDERESGENGETKGQCCGAARTHDSLPLSLYVRREDRVPASRRTWRQRESGAESGGGRYVVSVTTLRNSPESRSISVQR